MQNDFSTDTPIIFTAFVVGVFLFTSLVFVIYDCTVERRQRIVMKSAVRTTALVSALYPSAVRDRLLEQEDEKRGTKNRGFSRSSSKYSSEYEESTKGGTGVGGDYAAELPLQVASMPIASIYSETTVLFADIVGFTAWSSSREPSQGR